MRTQQKLLSPHKVLGLAMILAGVTCVAVDLAKGEAPTLSLTSTQSSTQAADAPHVENAKLESRAAGVTLESTIRELSAQASQPEWVGYYVDQVVGARETCCNNNWSDGYCGTCRLEKENNFITRTPDENHKLNLESAHRVAVLYRIDENKVMKVRVSSEECTLDAGGLRFIWLTGVKPTESVALLSSYVQSSNFEEHGSHHLGRDALNAIAMHADESANRALESFVKPDRPEKLRKDTAFWLGAARGKEGLATLLQMAKNDPSSDVRSQVTFALSVSKESGALDEMIHMAHDDTSSHVRGQALFWLAQKAGKKAVGTITAAIENDPDTDVKKKAVFALSQLPKDEGVPKLIEVAQTNHNPEVRKQAMFWLGQSNDPRALQFFEKVLTQ
jgi:HEAT repeat protein